MKRAKQNNKRIKQIKSNMNKNVLIHQKLQYWIVGIDLLVNWTIFSWTVIVWVRERCTIFLDKWNEYLIFVVLLHSIGIQTVSRKCISMKIKCWLFKQLKYSGQCFGPFPKIFLFSKISHSMVYRTRKSHQNNGIRCIGIEWLWRKSFYIYFNLNK